MKLSKEEEARVVRVARRKALIHKRGLIYEDIADKRGVSMVINERMRWPKMMRLIAKRLHVRYEDFWRGARTIR